MKLCFDSVEEVRSFVKDELKGARRGGKDDNEGGASGGQQAPAPLMPPTGQTFNPGGAPFTPPTGQTFNPGAPIAPEVTAFVDRISKRIDIVVTPAPGGMGQDINATLNWFRQQCGPEAAQATLDQIKTIFLPRLSVPALDNIAKLIAA